MTINSESCQIIPAPLVSSNLEMLGTFEKGDKPITRGATIQKEDRYMTTIRRALEGAFDPQVVENTFYSAKELCEKAKNPYLYERPEDLLNDARAIKKYVSSALIGLKEIEKTYRKEAEIVYFKGENKLITADKLKRIYEMYHPEFTPAKRSVTALISVFDKSSSKKSKSNKRKKAKVEQAVSARQFWQQQEQKKIDSSEGVSTDSQKVNMPVVVNDEIVDQTVSGRKTMKQSAISEPHQTVKTPKKKMSKTKQRVTAILKRMTQETLDKVRAKKRKKKPYKEKSFIRSFTKDRKKKVTSVTEELAMFADRSTEISKRYEHFDSHQEDKKKQKIQEGKKEQVSCFDLSMLSRIIDDYDGSQDDVRTDNSSTGSWSDDEQQCIIYKRREVIHQAETRRPLTRSISVYPGSLNRVVTTKKEGCFKGSSIDDNFLKERLSQLRTFTQFTDSGEDRTEDDYFSDYDEDPFASDND